MICEFSCSRRGWSRYIEIKRDPSSLSVLRGRLNPSRLVVHCPINDDNEHSVILRFDTTQHNLLFLVIRLVKVSLDSSSHPIYRFDPVFLPIILTTLQSKSLQQRTIESLQCQIMTWSQEIQQSQSINMSLICWRCNNSICNNQSRSHHIISWGPSPKPRGSGGTPWKDQATRLTNTGLQIPVGPKLQHIRDIHSDTPRIRLDILPFSFWRQHLQRRHRLSEQQRQTSKICMSFGVNILVLCILLWSSCSINHVS